MTSHHTLSSIATEFQTTKRTVQRWYKSAVDAHGEFGTLDGQTKQFTDEERTWIVGDRVAEVIDAEIEPVETAIVSLEQTASSVVPIHIDNLTINVTQANTQRLDLERGHFQQVNGQALQGIGQYLQADLVATVQETVAQNRHAVAGLNAQASVNLANSLGKKPPEGDGPDAA